MPRPDLPEGWFSTIPKTSATAGKTMFGVPIEVVFLLAMAVIAFAMWADDPAPSFDSVYWIIDSTWPWAAGLFLAFYLPALYVTRHDPWWVAIGNTRLVSASRRAVRTRGRSLTLSHYKAPR